MASLLEVQTLQKLNGLTRKQLCPRTRTTISKAYSEKCLREANREYSMLISRADCERNSASPPTTVYAQKKAICRNSALILLDLYETRAKRVNLPSASPISS